MVEADEVVDEEEATDDDEDDELETEVELELLELAGAATALNKVNLLGPPLLVSSEIRMTERRTYQA